MPITQDRFIAIIEIAQEIESIYLNCFNIIDGFVEELQRGDITIAQFAQQIRQLQHESRPSYESGKRLGEEAKHFKLKRSKNNYYKRYQAENRRAAALGLPKPQRSVRVTRAAIKRGDPEVMAQLPHAGFPPAEFERMTAADVQAQREQAYSREMEERLGKSEEGAKTYISQDGEDEITITITPDPDAYKLGDDNGEDEF